MRNSTLSFYDRFSFFYPVDLFLSSHKKALCDEINSLPDGRLLEIGMGNGSHLKFYKRHEIIGIDTSDAMLEIARKRNFTNIEIIQMNGEALSFENNMFDYVVLSHVIAVVDDPEKLLAEVYRVLKPEGRVFILNHFTPDHWVKYVDRAFGLISGIFHFKSVFHMEDVAQIKKLSL